MTRKRLIASLLVVVLSAVQLAAWALAFERLDPAAARQDVWQSLDGLLTVLPEPALLALSGCSLIVFGIGVGMLGKKRVPRLPTEHMAPLA